MTRLVLGLLPLIAFYVGERWGGLRVGVLAAMTTSLLDIGYGKLTEGRVNRVVIVSTVLVVVLGGLSLISEDDRFVLWSPVFTDLAFGVVLAGSLALMPGSLLEVAVREQEPDVTVDPALRRFFRGVSLRFALNLGLHAVLTAWAAGESRETWLFVSGPVQYGMLGVQMLGEVVLARRVLPPLDA